MNDYPRRPTESAWVTILYSYLDRELGCVDLCEATDGVHSDGRVAGLNGDMLRPWHYMAVRQQVVHRRSTEYSCRQLDHQQPLPCPTAATNGAIKAVNGAEAVSLAFSKSKSRTESHRSPAMMTAADARPLTATDSPSYFTVSSFFYNFRVVNSWSARTQCIVNRSVLVKFTRSGGASVLIAYVHINSSCVYIRS